MLAIHPNGGTYRGRFFYKEIINYLDLNELLHHAYILVKHIGFSYADVKGMTRSEVASFMKFYEEEVKREQDAYKRTRSSR